VEGLRKAITPQKKIPRRMFASASGVLSAHTAPFDSAQGTANEASLLLWHEAIILELI